MNITVRDRLTDTENKLVAIRKGKGRGVRWVMGLSTNYYV